MEANDKECLSASVWLVLGRKLLTVPAAPVNVSVTQLRAHSAMVTWNVPQGDTVIGYAISQQRQDGLMQRSIREVNTSSRWCVLWDLDEDTHYSVQVRETHKHTSLIPAMEGLGMTPQLETGELLIITTVLLLWAAVIALFCRQYDIIKDNDSNGTKEKAKRPSPIYHNGAVRSSRVTYLLKLPPLPPLFVLLQKSSIIHARSWLPGVFCFLCRVFVVASEIS
uniref:Fibronectin type III domain containing 4b n=1 Tax=Neolamprologus brichardi TaxID=32507 RepID=A0A3Q4MWU4_NEOBR